ncbi:MAG: dGTP triphosphohydrolase [bacterium]
MKVEDPSLNRRRNFKIFDRKILEEIEETTLAPYAKTSCDTHASRRFAEPQHAFRTAFQRDRDRIIHSRAFRRLKHKRQVFLTSESDHYRTRITHTLEVAQLARTMARALGLNEDLVEAIALGHDLGHTPFGHLGEVILNQIMTGAKKIAGQKRGHNFGGFKHNYQSLRIVDCLEKKYPFEGLNLTAPVREGILKHTRLKRGCYNIPDFYYPGLQFEHDVATTLEAQVVAICDEIAQRTHDLEDGLRAGLVDLKKVKKLPIVQMVAKNLKISDLENKDVLLYQGLLIRGLINFLVEDVINCTLENITNFYKKKCRLHDFDEELVQFSLKTDPLQKDLNKFIYQEIIDFSRAQWSDE